MPSENDSYGISIGLEKTLCSTFVIRNGAYFTEESSLQLRAVGIVSCQKSKREALNS